MLKTKALYLIILVLPLLSFFINIFSRVFGRKIASFGSILLILFSCFASLAIFYEVFLCHGIVCLKLFDWAEIGLIKVSFGLLFDSLSSVMILIIL
jgi:NADH:ubiquinone oxidoreductase subunit 5 (subunit L)/multisubunit Na+/H+ antiporter MnhA subunit